VPALPDYHPSVEQFFELESSATFAFHPYADLPEDAPRSSDGFDPMARRETIDTLRTASFDQVRRYLAWCRRGERFCDGHVDSELRTGVLIAALHRLRVLRSDLGKR